MAVLKILVSVALLGTVGHCQNGGIYTAYSPGQYAAAGGLHRAAPRLVPVKVRDSTSRLNPSYSYPYHNRPYPYYSQSAQVPSYASRQYRPQMTGYYRPTRQYYGGFEQAAQPFGYRGFGLQASPTASPVVLKRGRVLPAPSPYAASGAVQTLDSSGAVQYSQASPAVSTYRAPTPQFQAAPFVQVQQQQPQQPAYYVQRAPAARPLKVVKGRNPPPPTTDAVEPEEEEYPSDPNPQYNFSFDIKDDELTNYQNRQEERDGETIKGSYSVVDPDGYVRTVTYTADSKNGFQAKVTREPTDVKIKFPVPTEAPSDQSLLGKAGAPVSRGQQSYTPQTQYQPQYQSAAAVPQYQASAYATPQQAYASQPTYIPARTNGRFVVQPQSTQPRIVTRYRQQ